MLIDGKWSKEWTERDKEGNFVRMQTKFRTYIEDSKESDRGRYSLYVSYACPWAHRVIMTYELLGLENFINLITVAPHISDDGWYFNEKYRDSNYQLAFLRDLYLKSCSNYTGRVTVPILWDSKENVIVNNESSEIIKMLNGTFKKFGKTSYNLFPSKFVDEIEQVITYNYVAINNACYKTGFASTQEVYEQEVKILFHQLEMLNKKLESQKFLVAEQLTGADISLLPTLLRFDIAYYGIFKCNIKHLKDFVNIEKYKNRLLEIPEINKTFRPNEIKNLYYKIKELNPSGIVPLGPKL